MLRLCSFSALLLLAIGLSSAGCGSAEKHTEDAIAQKTDFRVRADVDAGLNADAGWAGAGWAGAVNENATVAVEQPYHDGVLSTPGRRYGVVRQLP